MSRRNVSRDINGIGEQLAVLRKDLNAVAEQVQTLVHHQAEGSQRLMQNMANDVSERGHRLIEGAQEQIASTYGDLEGVVRRNPFTAVAIAAGLGLIAGTLSRHR